jgi:hypothetical protein
MLQEILEDGHFYYECCGEECGLQLRAHITDEAVQLHLPTQEVIEEHDTRMITLYGTRMAEEEFGVTSKSKRSAMYGAVVALPPCPECASQTFIKADYVVKDLFLKMLCPVVNPETNQFYGYSMKRTHSLNFRLLNMLYEIGKLPEPPLLPVLSYTAIQGSELRGLPTVAVDSIFLAYAFTGQALTLDGVDQHILALAGASNVTPLIQSMKQQQIQPGNVATSPEQG